MLKDTLKSRLVSFVANTSKLGLASSIRGVPELHQSILHDTFFLDKDVWTIPARIHCILNDITTTPMCKGCHSKVVTWNSRKDEFRPSCSQTCAVTLNSWKNRKSIQKQTEDEFEIPPLSVDQFEPTFVSNFIKENCLRKDGNINGNLTMTPRNFVSAFGSDMFTKVMSDYLINHKDMDFAEYVYLLDHPTKICEVCGVNKTYFKNYKTGFGRTCSTVCGNNIPDKLDAIKSKLLDPSPLLLAQRQFDTNNRMIIAAETHLDSLIQEGKFTIIDSFPRTDEKQFDYMRYRFQCCECKNNFISTFLNRRCYVCEPKEYTFDANLAKQVSGDSEYEINRRSILNNKRLELDIYFFNDAFAIEVDGIYWHSFGKNDRDKEKTARMKHFEKANQCHESGIRLLSVIDIEWNDPAKRAIYESMISSRLGRSQRVHARECEVHPVNKTDAARFLADNHIQGACQHSEAIGLYKNKTLMAIMTFGKPRFSKNSDVELIRFCNRLGFNTIGGASRLLTHFARANTGKRMISYANRRFSAGKLYEKLGFTFINVSQPSYHWVKQTGASSWNMWHRMKFQKHRLHALLPNFDPDASEADNMFENGYRRLWDYGHFVYTKIL